MDPSTPPHIWEWDVLVTYRLNFSYFYFPFLQYTLRNIVASRLFEPCNLPDQPRLNHFMKLSWSLVPYFYLDFHFIFFRPIPHSIHICLIFLCPWCLIFSCKLYSHLQKSLIFYSLSLQISLRTIYQRILNPCHHPWIHTRDCNFLSSWSWGTRSKAFKKSIIFASSLVASSRESDMSWQTVIIWLLHEYPSLKPCWPSYNQSLASHTLVVYNLLWRIPFVCIPLRLNWPAYSFWLPNSRLLCE